MGTFSSASSARRLVGLVGLGIGRVDRNERGPDPDRLPHRGQELDDRAGEGAGQLHDGLLRLHLEEDLVQRDLVTGSDVPGHDVGLGEPLTEIGQREAP